MKKLLHAVILMAAVILLPSCGDMVDPGEAHLIRHANGDTEIVDKGRSYAWGRTKRYVLKTAPKKFPLDMKVLCGEDNVNMGVTLAWMGQFDTGAAEGVDMETRRNQLESIIAQVSGAQGDSFRPTITLDDYFMNVLDTFVEEEAKQVFSQAEPDEMNSRRKELADSVAEAVATRFKEKGFPVKTIDVNLTNLDFPDIITQQREDIAKTKLSDNKNAAQAEADVAAAQRDAELMAAKGEARLVEAEKEAAYFTKMAEAMDDKVLILRQMEMQETISENMLEAAKAAANGNSNTIVITPFSGGNMLGSSGEDNLLMQNALRNGGAFPRQ